MKILSDLKAEVEVEGTMPPHHDVAGNVLDQPQAGCIRFVRLGSSGLTISRGKLTVGIPLHALLELAEKAEPGLMP